MTGNVPAGFLDIERLLLSYAKYADEGMPEEIVKLFSSDAELCVPGRAVVGQEKLGRFFGLGKERDSVAHRTKHVLTNILVEQLAAGRASAVTYFQVLQGHGLSAWGRYIDELTEIDGVWRISRREVVVDGPRTEA